LTGGAVNPRFRFRAGLSNFIKLGKKDSVKASRLSRKSLKI
jgi:hypothetical protein